MNKREQAVELMTEFIMDMNRQRAVASGMPLDQVEPALSGMVPELNHVNGLIYDVLVQSGYISEH
jgi:hypothetical protein